MKRKATAATARKHTNTLATPEAARPQPETRSGNPLVDVRSCNQLRQKIGVVYGNPETTTGGKALKFYASVRLDIRKTGVVKNGEQVVGNKTRVKVVKNKLAPPFRECEFEVLYGVGIYAAGELVDLASEAGLIEKSGAYYSYNGGRIAQGRDKACQYLGEHPELADVLRTKLVDSRKAENAKLGAPAPGADKESEAA